MNTSQAAEKVGVSVWTIRRWCRTGKVTAAKAGRTWIIEPASLPIKEENMAIRQVEIRRETKTWRGDIKVTVETRTQIEGTVTERGLFGRLPLFTIDTGSQTVTVIDPNGGLYQPDMRPVQVGDRVRVLAYDDAQGADYGVVAIERI